MAMPRFTGGRSLTRLPSITMSPEVVCSSPAIMRRSVDLPQPDGPTKTTNSPSRTSSETLFTTSMCAEALDDVAQGKLTHGASPSRLSGRVPAAHGRGDRERRGVSAYLYSSISAEALSSAACGSASPVTTDCTMAIMAFWKPL